MKGYETWVEINTDNLKHNYAVIKKRIPADTKIIAVIKGNAYGHGAVLVAFELQKLGIKHFAVATINEGVELRISGLPDDCDILVLGSLHPDCAARAVSYHLISSICTRESAKVLSEYKEFARVHICVDVGMNRVGCEPQDLGAFIEYVTGLGIQIEGLFGHLPDVTSDSLDTQKQIQLFEKITSKYKNKYSRHLSNSPGLFMDKDKHCQFAFDFVRIGGAFYGNVKPGFHQDADMLKRLLTWKAKPTNVQYVKAGEGVGYFSAYVADDDFWLATLPIGYVDGLPFLNSSDMKGGKIKLGDIYCDIVGKLCMDQLMVRVPHKISLDAVFEILTTCNDEYVGVLNRAKHANTSSTDILSGIHPRLSRISVNPDNSYPKGTVALIAGD